MRNLENYLEEAKKHEVVFRLILDRFKKWDVDQEGLSIEEIYTKYSTGKRYGVWTILCFKEVEPNSNVFEFGWEDIAVLSGSGSVDLYTVENGQLSGIKNIEWWMS